MNLETEKINNNELLVTCILDKPLCDDCDLPYQTFKDILPRFNEFLKAAGFLEIFPAGECISWEWDEFYETDVWLILSHYLKYGQAYNQEIRSDKRVKELTEYFLRDVKGSLFFSNNEVFTNEDGVRCFGSGVGAELTNHTFEFGLFAINNKRIKLLIITDED